MKQNNKIEKYFSAIILAAGKSERLGFPKLSLKYDKHNTFIKYIVSKYESFACEEIVLVLNKIGNDYLIENNIKFSDNVRIVINEYPDWHRFYSLKIGVKSLSQNSPAFIHNVDNPFVNYSVLNELRKEIGSADYISPEFEGKGGHPILLSEKIINEIRLTQENQIHLKEFLNQFSKIKVSVDDEKILVNINTLEEYKEYFSV